MTTPLRCAVYCRLSVERPDQELGSIEVQRERCSAYIASQEGWAELPTRYDDDGFSGGTTERPALKRLLADIHAGKIDRVVTHRLDRISRSMIDFLQLMETFERNGASLVSVTQQFDTSTAWGRMVLNILMGFAQFEREMISERTRDKMTAARRRGKWTGGIPVLGYDVHPDGGKLVVNDAEAQRVRAIFDLYREIGSLSATCRELEERGWTRKRWTTKRGKESGGAPFVKATLHHFLTNPIFIGRVRHKGEEFDGEHEAIVEEAAYTEVQRRLRSNGHKRTAAVRNRYGAFLKGVLHCAHCGSRMLHSPTRKGRRVYRYYVCQAAQANGWSTCPHPSAPAGKLEEAVLGEIREAVQDPDLLLATQREAKSLRTHTLADVDRQIAMADAVLANGASPAEKRTAAKRRERLAGERDKLAGLSVGTRDVTAKVGQFTPLWDALTYAEQTELAALLIDRVDWDGAAITVRMKEVERA